MTNDRVYFVVYKTACHLVFRTVGPLLLLTVLRPNVHSRRVVAHTLKPTSRRNAAVCRTVSARARARVCVVQRRTNGFLPNAKDFSEWRKRSELRLIRGKRACFVARWQFVSTAPAHRTQLASGAVPARRQTTSSAHHRRRRWLHLLQDARCRPTDRPGRSVLFLAVLDPTVGHTMVVRSPFISVLCHSDRLFHWDERKT